MFEVDIQDVNYLTHAGTSYPARIFKPRGEGPFPAFVDLHGGAWIKGSYTGNDPINTRIAAGGVVIMAAEYRVPPAGSYPASVADVNYAVRWLKMNAGKYSTRPEMVGTMGTSAGGHLAVLAAMKPFDERYAAIPLEGGEAFDATAAQIVTMWPVICPATRYRENMERKERGDTSLAHREGAGFGQMKYWRDVETMEDGSPMLGLERGDKVETPDLLYVQAWCDVLHAKHNMDRFCDSYVKAGGHLETEMLEGEPYDLLRSDPDCDAARRAIRHIVDFAHGKRVQAKSPVSV